VLALYQAVTNQAPVLAPSTTRPWSPATLAFSISHRSGQFDAHLLGHRTTGRAHSIPHRGVLLDPSSPDRAYPVTFSVSDGSLSDSQSATITVSASSALLTVLATPSDGGTVSGVVLIQSGRTTDSGRPKSGWAFMGWNDGNTQNRGRSLSLRVAVPTRRRSFRESLRLHRAWA